MNIKFIKPITKSQRKKEISAIFFLFTIIIKYPAVEISLDSGSLFGYIRLCKMDKKKTKKKRYLQDQRKGIVLPFTRRNYTIFGVSILTILLGYWALATGPVDGIISLSLAPILLVVGYCILIPIAILSVTNKNDKQEQKS